MRFLITALSCALFVGCASAPKTEIQAVAMAQPVPLGKPLTQSKPEPPATPAAAPIRNRLVAANLSYQIDFSPQLQGAIDDWLTWKREDFIEALENFAHLQPKLAPIYAEAGLPEALLFGMAAKESLGRAHSYSPAGAVGLLQFMPATAMRYGLRMQDRMDLRLDAQAATRANAQYIRDQLNLLDQDLSLVLAAYNSGEGRLGRLHRAHPNASFWDKEINSQLPEETRDFVPMVLAASWLYMNPQQFGLPTFSSQHQTIQLTRPTSLGELTICLADAGGNHDGWFRTLRNLNPRWKPDQRMLAGSELEVPNVVAEAYAARCVDTPIAESAAQLHAANYPTSPSLVAYVVRRGDTLAAIARRVPCASFEGLVKINELKGPGYTLKLGQTLQVPRCG